MSAVGGGHAAGGYGGGVHGGGHGPGPGGAPGAMGFGNGNPHTGVPRGTPGHGEERRKTPLKKEHDFLPTRRAKKVSFSLAILAMLMGTFVVFGNVLGAKIWGVEIFGAGPFLLDAGILAFAVVWTVQDIMVQVFYEEVTNFFCIIIAGVNLVALLLLFVATLLPIVPGVTNLNFGTLFDFSVRVFIASSIGYLGRSLINNRIFDSMRTTTDDREDIVLRAVVSSSVGRVFDTVLFTVIAYAGRGDFAAFWSQFFTSFVVGMLVEWILSKVVTKPVSLWLIDYLKRPEPATTAARATSTTTGSATATAQAQTAQAASPTQDAATAAQNQANAGNSESTGQN